MKRWWILSFFANAGASAYWLENQDQENRVSCGFWFPVCLQVCFVRCICAIRRFLSESFTVMSPPHSICQPVDERQVCSEALKNMCINCSIPKRFTRCWSLTRPMCYRTTYWWSFASCSIFNMTRKPVWVFWRTGETRWRPEKSVFAASDSCNSQYIARSNEIDQRHCIRKPDKSVAHTSTNGWIWTNYFAN